MLENGGWTNVRLYGQQLNQFGRLREDMRRELHALATRPFNRLGEMIQRYARGHRSAPLLPEKIDDFEIVEGNSRTLRDLGVAGPFVLIGVADRA
jgi:hypothetical protein